MRLRGNAKLSIYGSWILPRPTFCCLVWHVCNMIISSKKAWRDTNPDPIFQTKKFVIFHTPFQTKPLKSIPILTPVLKQIMPSLLRLEHQQKRFLKIHFEFCIFLFLSYSFKIKTINTFIHPCSSSKTITDSRPKWAETAQKPCPLGRHIPIWLM